MPVYEYQCQQCGQISELLLRTLDIKDIDCPNCGSDDMKRLISASYMIKTNVSAPGTTCCGRTERCETPPCSTDEQCRRT